VGRCIRGNHRYKLYVDGQHWLYDAYYSAFDSVGWNIRRGVFG
jgi:hypothetical protein